MSTRLAGQPRRAFQEHAAATGARVTLVRAGCGTGKTVGAYLWAALRCPGRRLYVCYPTTGTATEGFRDYLYDPDERLGRFGADLFHGRADVDLEVVLGAGRDDESPETEVATRMESLDSWSTPIVSCTVDTVLGLVQNNRRGLYGWPAVAGAAFVFDEIHAYDQALFGALLRFLQEVRGAPVLLMTASLPSARLRALRRCLERLREDLAEIAGPADLEQLPRYHRHPSVADDPLPLIQAEIERGGKVLWVSNTVARAMAAAGRATRLAPLVYHSRFRYEDRVRRHAAVVDAFQPSRNPSAALAVCTQVAEMSLDLSATLLVTDLCPVPAFIQRLGRLNRRASPPPPGQPAPATMPFVVVEPRAEDGAVSPLPYAEEELDRARAWLGGLGAGELSQADLARAWEALDTESEPVSATSAWLDGGPRTSVCELRSPSPGITVVLERDLGALRTGPKRLAEVALPMPPPRSVDWRAWPALKGVPVAPERTIIYDAERGAEWRQ